MKITAKDVIALMKEVGIDEEIIKNLKNDAPLLDQGLDSIDLPAIAVATEKLCKVDLSDADATKLKTIDDFVRYVNGKMK
ncbi:MAG: acyl carrier protein [Syntrophales bacterium]